MASFTPAPNLLSDVERSARVAAARRRAAEQVAETARAIAPVGDPSEDETPSSFRDSIRAEDTRVVSDDPAAPYIIFGTSRTPPYDTLMRAAEMNGLKAVRE